MELKRWGQKLKDETNKKQKAKNNKQKLKVKY